MNITHYDKERSGFVAGTDKEGKDFRVPVVDVRDGGVNRTLINRMIKDSNRDRGSRYFGDGDRLKFRRPRKSVHF